MSDDVNKFELDGQTIITGGGAAGASVGELRETIAGTNAAFHTIVNTLRENRVHPIFALNALMNVWHAIAVKIAPEEVPAMIEALGAMHASYVARTADA